MLSLPPSLPTLIEAFQQSTISKRNLLEIEKVLLPLPIATSAPIATTHPPQLGLEIKVVQKISIPALPSTTAIPDIRIENPIVEVPSPGLRARVVLQARQQGGDVVVVVRAGRREPEVEVPVAEAEVVCGRGEGDVRVGGGLWLAGLGLVLGVAGGKRGCGSAEEGVQVCVVGHRCVGRFGGVGVGLVGGSVLRVECEGVVGGFRFGGRGGLCGAGLVFCGLVFAVF